MRAITFAMGLCAALWNVTGARAQPVDTPPAPPSYIENCVHDETIELHAGNDSALLDEDDRAGVQAAMVSRFTQLAGGGFAPTAILLWRSPVYGWLYVALKAHPTKPGKVCSMATFSAPVFEFTGDLLRKYFFGDRT